MNFIPILLTLVVLVNCEDDYCSICKDHVACNNDGKIAPKCSDKAKLIDLNSTKIKMHLLKLHNKRRNRVALGKLNNYDSAARMATMEWDDELAALAELNVKKCEFEHDKCHGTVSFPNSGQNLGQWKGFPAVKPRKAANIIFTNWFKENKDCNKEIINSFSVQSKPVGHFSIIVTDRNTKVGCALLQINEDSNTIYLMACNYATTNILGEPVYVTGATGSSCESGPNPRLRGLCSLNETINANA